TGGLNANINGPSVDFDTFFSGRGVLESPLDATKQASAAKFGLSYQVAAFTPASGWSNVPPSQGVPAQQTVLTVAASSAALNPTRTFDLYVYASGNNGYDKAVMVPTGSGKDGSKAAANLTPRAFSAVKLKGADGLIGTAAGESAGFYVDITRLAPDLSSF